MQVKAGTKPNAHHNKTSFELISQGQVSTKRLLRKAFSQHVHPEILQRPKMSFPVPFIEWFQSELKENFRSCLKESPPTKRNPL